MHRIVLLGCLTQLVEGVPSANGMWQKPLLRSPTLQGFALFGASDIIGQGLERNPKYDISRTLSFAAFGGIYVGSISARWYSYIDKAVPAARLYTLPSKLLANWIVLGTIGNTCSMVFQQLCANRGNMAKSIEYTRQNAMEVIINDLKVFTIFDCLLFTVIPTALRPTSVVLASLGWSTYLNMASHRTLVPPDSPL